MTTWMAHPNLPDGQIIEVPDAAVNGHMLSGWRKTDPPPPPVIEAEEPSSEEPKLTPAPGAKYAAAVESRPENQSADHGKEK